MAAPFEKYLEPLAIEGERDIVSARERVRDAARGLGFSAVELTLLATAVSEIARNIIEYAGHGTISLRLSDSGRNPGIEVVAEDRGPGIENIELALQDGYSTRRSLGMGLPGARRLVDEFQIESTVGKGTRVILRKWKTSTKAA
ncbi:MAG: anti-sigma regulatory factor [Oligoflexia bacterium]|nr:anti-sigma regulatory factor [Oligoflexia bacterium]